MLPQCTVSQLDIGTVSSTRANELGQFGYMQWLEALKPMADYRAEAMRACAATQPFSRTSPSIAVFCDLLVASTRMQIEPLLLSPPVRDRRGGARAQRTAI